MFDDPEAGLRIDESFCVKCKKGGDEDRTLVCEECESCCHMFCMRPKLDKLPKEDWYCSKCAERPVFGTAWIPLGDTPVDHGVLAVLPGTQSLPNYYNTLKNTNAQISASYFSHAKNLTWHSGAFKIKVSFVHPNLVD